MAVVKNYMQEEQNRVNNQKAAQPYGQYNTSPVSREARATLFQQPAAAKKYKLGANPGTYKSRYQGTLDNILGQILNPEEFHYEFNGDEMFKNYADLYTQYGKQAMLDTMGQAVGLTGGYGNSYAQGAGQQAYQNYLLPLYDRGFDLQQAAYGRYRDEMGDLKDAWNNMMTNEQYDYSRYGDAVNQWRLQQQMDAAAAASRGGGSGRGKDNTETLIPYDGKYYKIINGEMVEVTPEKDKKYYMNNFLQNAGKQATAGFTLKPVDATVKPYKPK